MAPENITAFLLTAGYFGLFLGIFVETGFLIGVIVPGGESLVFTAGFLSSLGYFDIWIVMLIVFAAAVLADSLEYSFGRKYGPRIFTKGDSIFFDKEYILAAEAFYERHGGKTIIIARFLPFIRTLAPAFAGVGKMKYSYFVLYNIIGALLWSASVSLLGYYLGKVIPGADQYALYIVLAIATLSLLSPLLAVARNKRAKARISKFVKDFFRSV